MHFLIVLCGFCWQVISDCILRSIMSSLRNLKVLSLCYCLGILTSLSFQIRMPNLTTLRLERVTPGMTNDDLIILTRGCSSLHDLSLIGCMLLNSGQINVKEMVTMSVLYCILALGEFRLSSGSPIWSYQLSWVKQIIFFFLLEVKMKFTNVVI